jgi:metal transporter CNNM
MQSRQVMFRRTQLKALVDLHGAAEGLGGTLTSDEVKVICGALDLTSKTARR